MKKNLRFSSGLIAAMLLLASCGQSGSEPETTTASGTTPEETTADYLSTIPDADFGGNPFRILVHSASDRINTHAGEENGEVINDTLYRRDVYIAERFNTEVIYTEFAARGAALNEANKLITAGEDAYEMILTSPFDGTGKLTQNGMLMDLSAIEALDLSQPWWNADMTEASTWGGKTFIAAGPIALNYCYSPYALYVNLIKAENMNLGNLYDIVDSGKWTIDEMNRLMKGAEQDVNLDGSYTVADNFMLTVTLESGNAFFVGCGGHMMEKNGDDAKFTIETNQSMDILDKLNSIMTQDGVVVTDNLGSYTEGAGTTSYKVALFTNSQTLFCAAPLQWGVLSFRDMHDDFSVLPYPKLDEAQSKYYTNGCTYFPISVAIPVTTSRADEVGAVMEAMCYYSYQNIMPEVRGTVLSAKIARDEGTVRMFDLIYENIVIDVNCIYNFGNTMQLLRAYAAGDTDNFASTYAAAKPLAETQLSELISAMTE